MFRRRSNDPRDMSELDRELLLPVARRVGLIRLLAFIIATLLAAPGVAHASSDSVTIAREGEPVQGVPLNFTVAGETAGANLWVFAMMDGSGRCYDSAWDMTTSNAVRLTPGSGEVLQAGPFSRSYSITPELSRLLYAPNPPLALCAYVVRSDLPQDSLAAATDVFTPRYPRVTFVATATPASIVPGQPVSVHVTGTAEVPATITAEVDASYYGMGCDGPSIGGQVVPVGAIDLHFSFVPPDDVPTTVCLGAVTQDRLGEDLWIGSLNLTIPRTDLPSPVLITPSDGGLVKQRGVTFAWNTAALGSDRLVITAADSASGTGGMEYDIGADGYRVGGGCKGRDCSAAKLRPLDSKVGYVHDPALGVTTVFLRPEWIDPGRYAWQVVRRTSARTVTSPLRRFLLAGPHMRSLSVRPRGVRGKLSNSPGRTDLVVTTAPWAHLRVRVTRGAGVIDVRSQWLDERRGVALTVPWSCNKPGGEYRYTVTAHDDFGKSLSRSGTFAPVSHSTCAAMVSAEYRQRSAARRRAAAQVRREAIARRRRFIANCKALGGTPVEINTSAAGRLLVCRSPLGGTMPVPM